MSKPWTCASRTAWSAATSACRRGAGRRSSSLPSPRTTRSYWSANTLAGLHKYELGLPKGTVSGPGETFEEAANRELKEEAGFGARRIEYLRELSVAPSHMGFTVHAMLARDLYPESLPGDEPEPPEVRTWPLAAIDDLFLSNELSEARSLAAIRVAQIHMGRG